MTPTTGFSRRLIGIVVLLLACSFLFVHSTWGDSKATVSTPAACNAAEPAFDATSDVQGVIFYKRDIQRLFAQEKFTELDCIADADRVSKARFAGGRWKLNLFYWAIEQPEGHAPRRIGARIWEY